VKKGDRLFIEGRINNYKYDPGGCNWDSRNERPGGGWLFAFNGLIP